jgi:hypothetical protein
MKKYSTIPKATRAQSSTISATISTLVLSS